MKRTPAYDATEEPMDCFEFTDRIVALFEQTDQDRPQDGRPDLSAADFVDEVGSLLSCLEWASEARVEVYWRGVAGSGRRIEGNGGITDAGRQLVASRRKEQE